MLSNTSYENFQAATDDKKSNTKVAVVLGLAVAACGLGTFMLARNEADRDGEDLGIAGFQDFGQTVGGWCASPLGTTRYADVNGDNFADMICDQKTGNHHLILTDGSAKIMSNKGQIETNWCKDTNWIQTSWADINGDGKADMLCDSTDGSHWAKLSKGDGSFYTDLGLYLHKFCWQKGTTTRWFDFDGDGKADMICDQIATGNHWVKISNGDGTFKPMKLVYRNFCPNGNMIWADINGDGLADMLCEFKGNHWANIQVQNGQFKEYGLIHTGFCTTGKVAWADIDGDGNADLLCSDKGNHWAQLSLGDGQFHNLGQIMTKWCTGGTTSWADLTGDGAVELICDYPNGSHYFYSFFNAY